MKYLELGLNLDLKLRYSDNKDKLEFLKFDTINKITLKKNLHRLRELYNVVNLYTNNGFKNFDADDLFFFRHFPNVPNIEDERYKTIKKYACKFDESDKTENFCTERYNCLKFELSARNPKNVEAIEEVVTTYEKEKEQLELFHDLIFMQDIALEKHNIATFTKDDESNLLILASSLNDKIKALVLVPYRYYNEHEERFSHWAINPKIYDVVNLLFRCFSLPIVEEIKILSDHNNEKIQFKTQKTYYYDIDRSTSLNPNDYRFQDEREYVKTIHYYEAYFLEHINKLNNFSFLIQSIKLPKLFDLEFMDYGDNMEYFKLNSVNVNKKVVPIQYYPDLEGNRKVDFEINVSAGITNASKLFDKLYTSLQTYSELKSKNKADIFGLELEEEDSSNIAVDLFYYDYFMYRQEQQKHILKYFNEIIELPQKEFNTLFKTSSKKELYTEMSSSVSWDGNKIYDDSIRKKIQKITDAITKKT